LGAGGFGRYPVTYGRGVYLLLWNRTPDSSVTMSGDNEIMDLWHDNR
jgi:hypothetical protein